jgi:hypothetical protein
MFSGFNQFWAASFHESNETKSEMDESKPLKLKSKAKKQGDLRGFWGRIDGMNRIGL